MVVSVMLMDGVPGHACSIVYRPRTVSSESRSPRRRPSQWLVSWRECEIKGRPFTSGVSLCVGGVTVWGHPPAFASLTGLFGPSGRTGLARPICREDSTQDNTASAQQPPEHPNISPPTPAREIACGWCMLNCTEKDVCSKPHVECGQSTSPLQREELDPKSESASSERARKKNAGLICKPQS